MANGTCSIEGCERKSYCRGWCERHYRRWKHRGGDPGLLLHGGKPAIPSPERFWAKVNKDGPDGFHYLTGANLGPCWLWTASLAKGYGRFYIGPAIAPAGQRRVLLVQAHVYAYELLVGPVPEGHELDHLCRVRPCVRHVEPVSHAENSRRGLRGLLLPEEARGPDGRFVLQ